MISLTRPAPTIPRPALTMRCRRRPAALSPRPRRKRAGTPSFPTVLYMAIWRLPACRCPCGWDDELFCGARACSFPRTPSRPARRRWTMTNPMARRRAIPTNPFLPVDQLSFTLQPRSDLSLSGYYQLEWRPRACPASAVISAAAMSAAPAPNAPFFQGGDICCMNPTQRPPSGGQYGLALKQGLGDTEIGLYALRYNAKLPVMRLETSPAAPSGYSGAFEAYYPRGN